MLITEQNIDQLSLELVQDLIKPIATISPATRPTATKKFFLVFRGLPQPIASLEQAVRWFQDYGQSESLLHLGRFSIGARCDYRLPTITAGEVMIGDMIQTCFDRRGSARVADVQRCGDSISLRLLYTEFTEDLEVFNPLWMFYLIEQSPDREKYKEI